MTAASMTEAVEAWLSCDHRFVFPIRGVVFRTSRRAHSGISFSLMTRTCRSPADTALMDAAMVCLFPRPTIPIPNSSVGSASTRTGLPPVPRPLRRLPPSRRHRFHRCALAR